MTSLAEKLPISTKDYFQGEASANCKHEYLNGEVWTMAGATDAHVTITMNLGVYLNSR
ncbi:hypothetical protein [Candidatus Methylomicrobium oryzae]|jgi:hypothetical protein|uniref:hypothetical protein n=1 Tax=Candidatus Methylomicrobium oryzae TaxID=2802053 RepID=UPI001923BCED|nr:hypothetical protein [Methylomicrobium sp. RS1]MBL1262384.1 hypothetical protein [Methylomicrobium sp. RS1]